TEENVQFESLNTDVVVVDKTTGKVTVMGNGKAVVKISAKNGDIITIFCTDFYNCFTITHYSYFTCSFINYNYVCI
ncbi:hypothetical protein, partial [Bacillus cereus]